MDNWYREFILDYIDGADNTRRVLDDLRREVERARDALDEADTKMVEVAIALSNAELSDVPGDCVVDEADIMEFHGRIGYALENLSEFDGELDTIEGELEE